MNRKKLNMLIKRAMAGEAIALEQLCQIYAKTILFQTRLLVKNKDDAEDVAQRVAIAMLGGIQKLRSPYAFRNWLQRLIVNACNKQNARTRQESERTGNLDGLVDTIIDDDLESRPEEHLDRADLQRSMGGYLEQLPPAQAVALTLYYYEQLSYKEVADALGITVGAVSSTISKAKGNLREMMKRRNSPGAFGIIALPPVLRDAPAQAVRDEVEGSVSLGAFERFMAVCKAHTATVAAGAGGTMATGGALGAVVATTLGLVLLTGVGIGAYVLYDPPVPEAAPGGREAVTVEAPDSRLTYSVAGEQLYDDPLNPLHVQLNLRSGEGIEGWVLTDRFGTGLAYGGGYAGRAGAGGGVGGTGAGAGAAGTEGGGAGAAGTGGGAGDGGAGDGGATVAGATSADGTFINITTLNLADGDYTLSWYLTDGQGGTSRIYWEFTIAAEG